MLAIVYDDYCKRPAIYLYKKSKHFSLSFWQSVFRVRSSVSGRFGKSSTPYDMQLVNIHISLHICSVQSEARFSYGHN